MQGAPTGFWGKLRFDEDSKRIEAWHPLEDHCADVAACCEALLDVSLIRRRLAALGGRDDLSPIDGARLCVLAALHDVGKFNLGFQNKAQALTGQHPPFTAGHVSEAVLLLGQRGYAAQEPFLAALRSDLLGSWGDAVCPLLVASICHHGRPIAVDDPDRQHEERHWKTSRGLDPFQSIRQLTDAALSWFPRALEEGPPLPDSSAFQHAFSGLLMLADWLGSDAHEEFFPFTQEGPSRPRIELARERARRAVTRMGLDTCPARALLGPTLVGFDRLSAHPPRPLQRVTLEIAPGAGPTLTVLEAETGAGKTEAALAHFARLLQVGQVDGLYFALPTRTAATQIHRRVVEMTARAFPEESARPAVVLAVPGYLTVDEVQGIRLPGFEVLWNDVDRERFRFRGWAAENPKRYLAGAIVVGTIDQVLLSTLQVAHAHLRSTTLLRHLLVVDEVHASDDYMTALLESVLRFHLAAGGHALLMSATLGAVARHRFLKAAGVKSPSPSLAQSIACPYPALTHLSPEAQKGPPLEPQPIAPPPPERAVTIQLKTLLDDQEAIARLALDHAQDGARTLVLRNTVRGCLAVQEALERQAHARGLDHLLFRCHDVVAPHHARFAREDRELLDLALAAAVGKEGTASGLVVVATQTIQQSLDVDFDSLLTDLCPMDVLLQRLGRLHRHAERNPRRPEAFRQPTSIVLTPEERDLGQSIQPKGQARGSHGIGTVYDDLLVIEATWRLLEEYPVLRVPTMSRELVERSTHPEALKGLFPPEHERWRAHHQARLGASLADRQLAHLFLVDRGVPFGEAAFQDADLQRRISTRLGEQDRLLTFNPPLPGPFGRSVRRLTLAHHLARDLSETDQPVALSGTNPGFRLGDRRFHYDRLGLRPAEGEPNEEATDA